MDVSVILYYYPPRRIERKTNMLLHPPWSWVRPPWNVRARPCDPLRPRPRPSDRPAPRPPLGSAFSPLGTQTAEAAPLTVICRIRGAC